MIGGILAKNFDVLKPLYAETGAFVGVLIKFEGLLLDGVRELGVEEEGRWLLGTAVGNDDDGIVEDGLKLLGVAEGVELDGAVDVGFEVLGLLLDGEVLLGIEDDGLDDDGKGVGGFITTRV